MSPGHTFERVYQELKEQLRNGRHPPGSHLEPGALTEELCSSITPIRDALHRLVGERLVEAPRNDGFRVPMMTEVALRQLYRWQADLLWLAVGRFAGQRAEQAPDAAIPTASGEPQMSSDPILELARNASNPELTAALVNACDRLAPIRMLEERLIPGLGEDLEQIGALAKAHEARRLKAAITAHNKRRDRAVPQIVAALQSNF